MTGHAYTSEHAEITPGRVILRTACQCNQPLIVVAASLKTARQAARRAGRDHRGFARLTRGSETP